MCMRSDPRLATPETPYSVELLYDVPPRLSPLSLFASISERCPDVSKPEPDKGPMRFHHTGHRVGVGDAALPVQTFVAVAEAIDEARIAEAAQQSWKWRSAKQTARACLSAVVVTDMLASGLDPRLRLGLFQRVLDGVLEAAPCLAIHWLPAQHLVDPGPFRQALARGDYGNPLLGAVNVRLFQIAGYGDSPVPGGTGDSLMDTLGLSAFGLPDLQCHFHGLAHDDVAKVLYSTAESAFRSLSPIKTGDALPGTPTGTEWRCRLERSLQPPNRVVIDLNPGELYAAGARAATR